MTFLTDEIMEGNDWRALELAVVRLLSHCGWRAVQDVGRSGDKGADILAVYRSGSGKEIHILSRLKLFLGDHTLESLHWIKPCKGRDTMELKLP